MMMTERQAVRWVHEHTDDDELDDDDLRDAFMAIFGRAPDAEEMQHAWSHLCAAVETR